MWITLFVHFVAVVARLRDETSQFRAPTFTWTQHKNVLFPFLNLETVLSDLTPENFAKFDEFNKIEWDRWSLKQREFTF